MGIRNYIDVDCVNFALSSTAKHDVFMEMAKMLHDAGKIENVEVYVQAVQGREDEYTTGIGGGVAIPHGKARGIKRACIAYGRVPQGVEWGALDAKPVTDIFLLAIPEEEEEEHLDMLSTLARKLMHQEVKDAIHQARDTESFFKALDL